LSSLISQDSASNDPATSRARARPSKTPKSDIFTRHNKGTQKRAAADLADDASPASQVHQRTEDIGSVDAATLHRSKRRMQEKARIYGDLRSGMYLAGESDEDDDEAGPRKDPGGDDYLARLRRKEREGLVDFDRKWGDEERMADVDEADDDDDDDDNASTVSYEDELGRTRHGTRAEAARAKAAQESSAADDPERWRPTRPDNLIYGPAVQPLAFNPSTATTSQMDYLASRRDRSPTPPEETHYDPDKEVRTRGTGFYAFSKDEEVRRRQMEELMHVREETQREREERAERRAHRERVRDERRGKVAELRTRRRADTFLAGLGGDLAAGSGVV
ncbi:hypothetical protein PHISP_08218, partial [Aspergillus sp. HF37]